MANSEEWTDLGKSLDSLPAKNKAPFSVDVLNSWIAHAENEVGSEQGGRLAWLIASTVVTAMLQRIVDGSGQSRFSMKGGTYLQHRLGLSTRATKDLDGIVRGDIDDFMINVDQQIAEPWGPIGFRRTEVEIIRTPAKVIKPRRFNLILTLRGKTWRKIKVEISPDEGLAGSSQEQFDAPSLAGFGLPTPDHLVGIAMSYQTAQKIHTATDPHDPPEFVNERARDVVDLLLIMDLAKATNNPNIKEIRMAVEDIFEARAQEARSLGRPARVWPSYITAYEHWIEDFSTAAKSAGLDIELNEAVNTVNAWIKLLYLE